MKATLEFDLDDPEDRMSHLRASKSTDLCLVLCDLDVYLRELTNYQNAKSVKISELQAKLSSIKEDHGIVLDDLIR